VRLARPRRVLRQDLVAREGRVAAAAAVPVAADVAVGVPDVVPVLLVEDVVGDGAEAAAPVLQRVFEGEAQAFEEERVLQARVVLEVVGGREGVGEPRHAEREGGGEGGDRGGGYGAGGEGGVGGRGRREEG